MDNTDYQNYSTTDDITCWWCGKRIKPGQTFILEQVKSEYSGEDIFLVMHKKCADEFRKSGGWSELYEFRKKGYT